MLSNNGANKLREAYENFKDDNYIFGNYTSESDIHNAYNEGKVFVLKGRLSTAGLILLFVCWFIDILMIIIIIFTNQQHPYDIIPVASFSIIIIFLFFSIGCSLLYNIKMFLVIGPQGLYYKKYGPPKYLNWKDLIDLQGIERDTGWIKIAIIKCYFLTDKKQKFRSNIYSNKEFPKDVYNIQVWRLFLIYWKLSRAVPEFYPTLTPDPNSFMEYIGFIERDNINAITDRIHGNFESAINIWSRSLINMDFLKESSILQNPDFANQLNFRIEQAKKNIQFTQQDLENFMRPEFKQISKFVNNQDFNKRTALVKEFIGNFRRALTFWNRSLNNLNRLSSRRIDTELSNRIEYEREMIKLKIFENEQKMKFSKMKDTYKNKR